MVSVIMPVYNAQAFLREAVSSVLSQTHRNLELIAVDDGSTDASPKILDEIAKTDNRLRYIVGAHGGACKARNLAIRESLGEWVVAMDADDVSVPNRIEVLLSAAARQPEVVLWGSYATRIGPAGDIIGPLNLGPASVEEFNQLDLCRNIIPILNPTAMFRADIALKLGGYNEKLEAAQEAEFWDRLVAFGPACTVPKPLLLYRLHENTISFKKQRIQKYLHGYAPARRRAALEGRKLDLDTYLTGFKARMRARDTILCHLEDFSRRHIKLFLIRKSQGRIPVSVIHAALAVISYPKFVFDRIRVHQKYSA